VKLRKRANPLNEYQISIRLSDDTLVNLISTTLAASGTWAFVVGTWDRSSLMIYVNEGDAEASKTATSITATTTEPRVGTRSDGTEPWNGIIDEVRIYNRALSATEISNLYNGVSKLYPKNVSGIWQVKEGEETINFAGVDYIRSYSFSAVQRDSSGNIVSSGGSDDPSTKKVRYTVRWGSRTVSGEEYITRSGTRITIQTDWSGGATSSGIFSRNVTNYESASSVDVLTVPGTIQLQTQ
jgi:hypothetical protein